jgi:hypothetical protein
MNYYDFNCRAFFVSPFGVAIILLFILNGCFAETPSQEMHEYLATNSVFLQDDLLKLDEGTMIGKLLPVNDKREVAVCGVISIKAPLETSFKAFKETMSRQNKSSVIDYGSFSPTPIIGDIQMLKLDQKEVDDIRKCRVGNCKMKLSAAMIERFQREIDWNSGNYAIQVDQLFRQMILDYVTNFTLKGDSALIEYRDQREILRLQDEHKSLLNGLLWIQSFAPEFSKYIANSATYDLPNVRKSVSWTKLKFGLKPVIVITQTLTYETDNKDNSQIITISKQIYANHYFDSSLGLTAFVKFSKNDSEHNSYMFYTNHSRSSSLDGAFSKFKRDIVEQEALRKLTPLLQETKTLSEANFNRLNNNNDESKSSEGKSKILDSNYLIWFFYMLGMIVVIFLIGKGIKKIVNHQ